MCHSTRTNSCALPIETTTTLYTSLQCVPAVLPAPPAPQPRFVRLTASFCFVRLQVASHIVQELSNRIALVRAVDKKKLTFTVAMSFQQKLVRAREPPPLVCLRLAGTAPLTVPYTRWALCVAVAAIT